MSYFSFSKWLISSQEISCRRRSTEILSKFWRKMLLNPHLQKLCSMKSVRRLLRFSMRTRLQPSKKLRVMFGSEVLMNTGTSERWVDSCVPWVSPFKWLDTTSHTCHTRLQNSKSGYSCRVFSRTQWEHILFVCYETSGFDLVPNITQSSDDRHRDPWSVNHRWEIQGSLESTHGYMLVFTFPPSMFGCSMFQTLCPVFFEKTSTESK